MKRSKKKKTRIELSTEQLQTEIQSLFNTFYNNNQKLEYQVENDFNNLFQINTDTSNTKYSINDLTIEDILKLLKNGKRAGISGLTNEMLKYGNSTRLVRILKLIFEKIIQGDAMPFHFNISIPVKIKRRKP